MLKTMKEDMPKAVEFSNTFRYINDLVTVNNNFGNFTCEIYPSEMELKDNTLNSHQYVRQKRRLWLPDC